MDNVQYAKLGLLSKKINEFFAKNPKSKSVVVEMNLPGDQTTWNVTKTTKGFSIVEKTLTNERKFLVEEPVGQREDDIEQAAYTQGQQAGVQQAQAQQQQQQAMMQQPPPGVAPIEPVQPITPAPGPMMQPVEPPPEAMPDMPIAPQELPGAKPDQGDAAAAADAMRHASKTDPTGFKQQVGVNPEIVPPDIMTDTEPPDERGGEKLKASRQPQLREKKSLKEDIPFQPKVSEEVAMVRNLKGQVIEDASFVTDEDTARLELKLATTSWPVALECEKGGRITFVAKNRKYLLQKKWN